MREGIDWDPPAMPAAPAAFAATVQDGEGWLRFEGPLEVLVARTPGDVVSVLARAERFVEARGLHAVGFLCYEAAAAFGLAVRGGGEPGLPLACFGLFEAPQRIPHPPLGPACEPGPWQPALGPEAYARAVREIQERIAAGDTYQANLTFPLRAPFAGDAWAFFCSRVPVQRARYATFLDLGRYAVASLSPELFLLRDGERLETRPMKGTAARGVTEEDDSVRARGLLGSAKDRAENLMIVDMLRNDLGRVAELGSVAAPELFAVERYPTLFQMTSTVTARSPAATTEVVSALFPCASVTGAPKMRTMQILAELEAAPRGLYTGAIGVLAPGRRAAFSVAIRTLIVDRDQAQAVYGVGSGITADSAAEDEYAECLLKGRVLQEEPFRLLETLRYTPGEGFFLLDEHLDRLRSSASYFGIPAPPREILVAALSRAGSGLAEAARVRLLVDLEGGVGLESAPLGPPAGGPVRVGLATTPVDPASRWLYHKTTRRQLYDEARRSRPDCDDVLLWNPRGELTEACLANVVVELPEGACTPPVPCGLLAGTLRRHLLETGRIRERVIHVEEAVGRSLYLINSVQGWREAVLHDGAYFSGRTTSRLT